MLAREVMQSDAAQLISPPGIQFSANPEFRIVTCRMGLCPVHFLVIRPFLLSTIVGTKDLLTGQSDGCL